MSITSMNLSKRTRSLLDRGPLLSDTLFAIIEPNRSRPDPSKHMDSFWDRAPPATTAFWSPEFEQLHDVLTNSGWDSLCQERNELMPKVSQLVTEANNSVCIKAGSLKRSEAVAIQCELDEVYWSFLGQLISTKCRRKISISYFDFDSS